MNHYVYEVCSLFYKKKSLSLMPFVLTVHNFIQAYISNSMMKISLLV
jgi:hypothetical protein